MKNKCLQVIAFVCFVILSGCKTATKIQYVPVESVKTEYRDNYSRDSVFLYDSIFVKEKGDTVWLEKYRIVYRDRLVRDSIFISDTIPIPVLIDVPGPQLNYVTGWQNFQIWLGRVLIGICAVFLLYTIIKRKL
jgi:hypothetical protein